MKVLSEYRAVSIYFLVSQNVFFSRLHESFSSNSFSELLETVINFKESIQMLTF